MTSDSKRDESLKKLIEAKKMIYSPNEPLWVGQDLVDFHNAGYDAAMAVKDERVKEIKTSVEIKLLFLIGCCRMKNISKKQIETSIEQYIKTLKEMGE